jgi:hypothetical protein
MLFWPTMMDSLQVAVGPLQSVLLVAAVHAAPGFST